MNLTEWVTAGSTPGCSGVFSEGVTPLLFRGSLILPLSRSHYWNFRKHIRNYVILHSLSCVSVCISIND